MRVRMRSLVCGNKRIMRMRPIIILLATLFVILQYALWFSAGGIVGIWHLKREMAALNAENAQSGERNAVLEADVVDLKKGNEAIEERARNDLGMIKKGETFYQIVK